MASNFFPHAMATSKSNFGQSTSRCRTRNGRVVRGECCGAYLGSLLRCCRRRRCAAAAVATAALLPALSLFCLSPFRVWAVGDKATGEQPSCFISGSRAGCSSKLDRRIEHLLEACKLYGSPFLRRKHDIEHQLESA
jgi:hypothetical protein